MEKPFSDGAIVSDYVETFFSDRAIVDDRERSYASVRDPSDPAIVGDHMEIRLKFIRFPSKVRAKSLF